MYQLTPDEFDNLEGNGKGRFTKVYSRVIQLKPGTGLVIEKSEWFTKSPPYRVIRNVMKNTGRKFIYKRMPDGSGWWVKRIA